MSNATHRSRAGLSFLDRRRPVASLQNTATFDTTSWTVPSLVGTTLYARDREKILALDLGAR